MTLVVVRLSDAFVEQHKTEDDMSAALGKLLTDAEAKLYRCQLQDEKTREILQVVWCCRVNQEDVQNLDGIGRVEHDPRALEIVEDFTRLIHLSWDFYEISAHGCKNGQ
jgi:hypothetical protein